MKLLKQTCRRTVRATTCHSSEAHLEERGTSNTNDTCASITVASTLQAGCFLACFITPWMTDRWGRRWALIATGTVTILGVIMQSGSANTGNLAAMYVGRFVAGLGVGAASMLTPLYVSECAPRAIRGGLTAFYQLFIVTGVMIAFWVNYGCLLHLQGKPTYAVPLALQAVPAL